MFLQIVINPKFKGSARYSVMGVNSCFRLGRQKWTAVSNYNCKTYYQEENRTAKAWLKASGRHRDYSENPESFAYNWVVLSQVLEHIVDPVSMLTGLQKQVARDGKLFVEVPHHGAWDDSDIGFLFEHVNYFSPETLTAALDRSGYRLLSLEVTTDAHYFEGRGRIIRACVQLRSASLLADAAESVRDHDQKHKLRRFKTLDTLSRELGGANTAGLAIYGAAELADGLLRHFDSSGGHVEAIFDSDARKTGMPFGKLVVQPPEEISKVNPEAIVILSSAEADIRETIANAGFRGRVICWSQLS